MKIIEEFVADISFSKMIQFLTIDKIMNSELYLTPNLSIKLSKFNEYEFYLGDNMIISVPDLIEIDYIVEIDMDQIL